MSANNHLVGLERTFRFFQSVVQITLSYRFAFSLLLQLLGLSVHKAPQPATAQSVLLDLRQRLDLGRRYFRVFRFLEFLHGAQKLSASITSQPATENSKLRSAWTQADAWLDVFGSTFCGMYLLLETSTIVDYLQIEGLEVWGPEWQVKVNAEAQRFWFFTLACGIASSLVKIFKLLMYPSEPVSVDESVKREAAAADKKKREKAEKTTAAQLNTKREARQQIYGLSKNIVSNAIDIILPGAIVGWIDVSPGHIGVAMFVTTIITSMDVWDRCGREVSAHT